jgi:hypothetical protein
MRRGGIDIDRAPQEALDLVIDANLPVEEDHPALRERGSETAEVRTPGRSVAIGGAPRQEEIDEF